MEKFIENAALTKSFLKLFNEYPLDDNNNEDDDFENFYDKDTHQLEIAPSEWRGNSCYANFKKTENGQPL